MSRAEQTEFSSAAHYFDSRLAIGRQKAGEQSLSPIDKKSNPCEFPVKFTMHDIAAIDISNVHLDSRIPKLAPTEREAKCVQFIQVGFAIDIQTALTMTNWELKTVKLGPYNLDESVTLDPNNLTNFNSMTSSGAQGTLAELLGCLNMVTIDRFPVNYFHSTNQPGRLNYNSRYTNNINFVALVDCPFNRKLGFTDYKYTITTSDGQTLKINLPTADTINTSTSLTLANKNNDFTLPDLYLRLDFDTKSELNGQHDNIVYKASFPETYSHQSSTFGQAAVGDLRSYIDKDKTRTPINVHTHRADANSIRLSWVYADGSLADLDGADWSLCMNVIHNHSILHK